jgi:tRNA threonylcarbamoyl adenosine modification protein (Sua5/YciO/YrdC/YwlC family)
VTRRFDVTDPGDRATAVQAAVTSARHGRLVLLPTESVYGLLTDAFAASGVAALRHLKGRPDDAPLPVAVGSLSMLAGVADRLGTSGQALVDAFWPGPLTIVCRQHPSLAWSVGGGLALTVRMPLHPLALEVIRAVGPCVLLGADPPLDLDPTGQPAPGVDVVLESGRLPGPGMPSTVVDVRSHPPVLRRRGALGADRLVQVVPDLQVPDLQVPDLQVPDLQVPAAGPGT